MISFRATLDRLLVTFATILEFFDLFIEAQKSFVSSGVQLLALNCGSNGTAFVGAVFAVVKLALHRQIADVDKLVSEGSFIGPHLDFADAGIIDENTAFSQYHDLASGRCVAAFS